MEQPVLTPPGVVEVEVAGADVAGEAWEDVAGEDVEGADVGAIVGQPMLLVQSVKRYTVSNALAPTSSGCKNICMEVHGLYTLT